MSTKFTRSAHKSKILEVKELKFKEIEGKKEDAVEFHWVRGESVEEPQSLILLSPSNWT